ncbi:hypothetical protein N9C84_03935 [Desulfobacterales bacterium]|nr:hypothetical protein [Desulfobacterales bacterium]
MASLNFVNCLLLVITISILFYSARLEIKKEESLMPYASFSLILLFLILPFVVNFSKSPMIYAAPWFSWLSSSNDDFNQYIFSALVLISFYLLGWICLSRTALRRVKCSAIFHPLSGTLSLAFKGKRLQSTILIGLLFFSISCIAVLLVGGISADLSFGELSNIRSGRQVQTSAFTILRPFTSYFFPSSIILFAVAYKYSTRSTTRIMLLSLSFLALSCSFYYSLARGARLQAAVVLFWISLVIIKRVFTRLNKFLLFILLLPILALAVYAITLITYETPPPMYGMIISYLSYPNAAFYAQTSIGGEKSIIDAFLSPIYGTLPSSFISSFFESATSYNTYIVRGAEKQAGVGSIPPDLLTFAVMHEFRIFSLMIFGFLYGAITSLVTSLISFYRGTPLMPLVTNYFIINIFLLPLYFEPLYWFISYSWLLVLPFCIVVASNLYITSPRSSFLDFK